MLKLIGNDNIINTSVNSMFLLVLRTEFSYLKEVLTLIRVLPILSIYVL